MKEFLKTLNNFRLSSLIMSVGSLLGIVAVVLFLVFYQTSGLMLNSDNVLVQTIAFYSNQVAGMMFFLFAICSIVLGIVLIAKAFPFVMPKSKLQPVKSLSWILLAQNLCLAALIIMVFFLLGTEVTNHAAGWTIGIVIGTFSFLFSLVWIYPTLKCDFYCPEFGVPLFKRPSKVEAE